ncbi:MAG: hypothetical protein AAB436_02475 [Patescibacteria group bacterium]
MEGAPLFVEDDDSDDKKESTQKVLPKKPVSFSFANFAQKSQESDPKDQEPKEDQVPKPELTLVEAEPVGESEAPLEQIGEDEKPIIERQLTIVAQETDAELASDDVTDPEVAAGDQAVEHFRDLIIENGEDSEIALRETLAELGVEDDKINDLAETSETPPDTYVEAVDEEASKTSEHDFAAQEVPVERAAETSQDGEPVAVDEAPTNDGTSRSAGRTEIKLTVEQGGNAAASAVAAGVVGYLLGRRKGRIKTEQKLLPIQNKLEKQVHDLGVKLKQKEEIIRTAAARKVRAEGPPTTEKVAVKETSQIKQPEHIGHMVVNAPETDKAKLVPGKTEKLQLTKAEAQPIVGKRVENLSRAELLVLSEKIIVEGTSLRQIYETRLLGERGLRRLVAEHLRGGDLSKALKREIVEREIDFERDPAIRDVVPAAAVSTGNSGASHALNDLLKAAKVDVNDGVEEVAFFRARARYEAGQLHKHQQQRRIINISFVVVILLLILAIIILYATRG